MRVLREVLAAFPHQLNTLETVPSSLTDTLTEAAELTQLSWSVVSHPKM